MLSACWATAEGPIPPFPTSGPSGPCLPGAQSISSSPQGSVSSLRRQETLPLCGPDYAGWSVQSVKPSCPHKILLLSHFADEGKYLLNSRKQDGGGGGRQSPSPTALPSPCLSDAPGLDATQPAPAPHLPSRVRDLWATTDYGPRVGGGFQPPLLHPTCSSFPRGGSSQTPSTCRGMPKTRLPRDSLRPSALQLAPSRG